jgi:hypothetical protein
VVSPVEQPAPDNGEPPSGNKPIPLKDGIIDFPQYRASFALVQFLAGKLSEEILSAESAWWTDFSLNTGTL